MFTCGTLVEYLVQVLGLNLNIRWNWLHSASRVLIGSGGQIAESPGGGGGMPPTLCRTAFGLNLMCSQFVRTNKWPTFAKKNEKK